MGGPHICEYFNIFFKVHIKFLGLHELIQIGKIAYVYAVKEKYMKLKLPCV